MLGNLKVFDGLRGVSAVYAVYGSTYFFSYFGIIENPYDIDKIRGQFGFIFIAGSFFTAYTFFFLGGFLSAFSFLQTPQEERYTAGNLGKYYAKKLLKYMPFNIFIILFSIYLQPTMGEGPIWNKYAQFMTPCNTYWYTNLFYFNNLYPSNFDQQCMPWLWFLPAYIQLSLLLPLLMLVY